MGSEISERGRWEYPHQNGHEPPDLPQVRGPAELTCHVICGKRLHPVDVLPRLAELLRGVVPHVPADPARDQGEEIVAVARQEPGDDAEVAHLDHGHLVVRVSWAWIGAEVADQDVPVVHVEIDDAIFCGQGCAENVYGYELLSCRGVVVVVVRDEARRGPASWIGQSNAGSEEAYEYAPHL